MHPILQTVLQSFFFVWGWMFIVVSPVALATSGTVSLEGSPAFASQRPCVRNDCFGADTLGNPYLVASKIGCDTNSVENECFCRPDLQAGATSYLSSCVYSACDQMTLDVNSAVKIYTDYCTSNGFTTTAPSSSPTTSAEPTTTTSTSTSYPSSSTQPSSTGQTASHTSFIGGQTTQSPTTTTTAAVATSATSSSSNEGNGLNVGGIVGIVVGILGFLATAAGSWFSYKALKNRKNSSANVP